MLKLLRKHEEMFDGTLGNFTGLEYKLKLSEGARLYHIKPFIIPKIHKETLKMEVNTLMNRGILKRKISTK